MFYTLFITAIVFISLVVLFKQKMLIMYAQLVAVGFENYIYDFFIVGKTY